MIKLVAGNPRGRSIHIAVMGTWNWVEVAAELLRRAGFSCECIPDFPTRWALIKWVLQGKWRRFDAIHCVRRPSWAISAIFVVLRKPMVWHWIGTDVMQYGPISRHGGGWRGFISRWAAHKWSQAHLAASPDLCEELSTYGVQAQTVRLLPSTVESPLQPLPINHCVLAYWHRTVRDFHQAPLIMKLAAAFPQIPFLVLGDEGEGLDAPKNVRFLGRVPSIADIYSQISIYVRMPKHDGGSAMVLEALARGRYVVYNKKFPFTETASTFDEAHQALDRLLTMQEPNVAGAEYVRKHFSLQTQSDELKRLYDQLLGTGRQEEMS